MARTPAHQCFRPAQPRPLLLDLMGDLKARWSWAYYANQSAYRKHLETMHHSGHWQPRAGGEDASNKDSREGQQRLLTMKKDPEQGVSQQNGKKALHWGQRDAWVIKSSRCSPEDSGSVSNTHMVAQSHLQFRFQGSCCLLWAPGVHVFHEQTCRENTIHIK